MSIPDQQQPFPPPTRRARLLRWSRRLAIVAVVGLLVFVFGWSPWWLAGVATTRSFRYNDKENAGLTPATYKLQHEDVALRTSDGVDLRGWWVPAAGPARGTVVMIHGLNRSRIEMIRKVPFVHANGWNALLIDLRHHGESGGSVSSFGWFERLDVRAARELASQRSPGPVVVWGVSLGGAAVLLEAAEDPAVSAVIADSAFLSLRDTVHHHLKLARNWRWWLRVIPQWPVADEVIFWIGRRGGFDPGKVDLQAAARELDGRPALFVCNSGDRRIPPEVAFALKDAAGARAQVLVVPGNSHGGAWRDGTAAYEAAVKELLEAASAAPAQNAAGPAAGREPTANRSAS